jgi:hypothetical protein
VRVCVTPVLDPERNICAGHVKEEENVKGGGEKWRNERYRGENRKE